MPLINFIGEIIQNKYRITDILGRGGVAITYRAVELETDSPVAIKVISLKQLDNWKQVELFQREAEVLKQLEHSAIPRYIDYFDIETQTDKVFYLVQQIAPGKSLHRLVESGWRVKEEEIKDIARQVLSILSYLHSLDPAVIHRDIKPHNIIRDDSGKIYLVDFGAAQNTYYNTLMQGSTVVGTYGYMSPEQFRGQALPATDLYSLGATLLYLLTHRSPAELPQDTLKLNFKDSVDVSDSFAEWLDKILEPDVEDRFSNAEVALSELSNRKNRKTAPFFAVTTFGLALFLIGSSLFNSYQWLLLTTLGYYPASLCSNVLVMNNYLKTKGRLNEVFETKSDRLPRYKQADCINTMHLSLFKLEYYDNLQSKEKQDIINFLIEQNIDLNRNIRGINPLINTINIEDREMFDFLLDKGLAIDLKDRFGLTALFHTVGSKNTEIAKELLDRGADVNIRNNLGRTPLHIAAFNSNANLEIVKLLIARGADVNAVGRYNMTPLHLAVNLEVIDLLIARGADVNALDDYRKTPLHLVVERDDTDFKVIDLLIARGAHLNIRDLYGHTPLSRAIVDGNTGVAMHLVERGADLDSLIISNRRTRHSLIRKRWSNKDFKAIEEFFNRHNFGSQVK